MEFERESSRQATRTLQVDMELRAVGTDGIALELTDARGINITTAMYGIGRDMARTPQTDAQQRVLSKLGGTIYKAGKIDNAPTADIFIPASALTTLRRDAFALLDRTAAITYRRDMRRKENPDTTWTAGRSLSRHDNVANSLAEQVYREHGVTGKIEPAAETTPRMEENPTVMTTRYCVRRELGACLRTPEGASLKGPLTLTADIAGDRRLTLRLDFDCAACRMKVVKI